MAMKPALLLETDLGTLTSDPPMRTLTTLRRWFAAAAIGAMLSGVCAWTIGNDSQQPPVRSTATHTASATDQDAALVVPDDVRLCQALGPAAPHPIWGVDSLAGRGCGEVGWDARGCIPWQEFAQGEYVGHARTQHVPEYRMREGDVISVYYRRTREELSRPYELEVGDRIRIESLTAGSGTTIAPGA